MEMAIPQKLVKVKHSLPWISKDVIKAIRKRKKLYKKYKVSNLSIHKAQYQHQRNHTLSLLRESKNNYMQQLNTRDSKKYWKVVKSLNKSGTSIPTLVVDNKKIENPKDKADALNQFFKSCFNKTRPPLQETDMADILGNLCPSECPTEFLCDESQVETLLSNLNVNKSSGPDKVSPKMLKLTSTSVSPVLTEIFNLSISTGAFPTLWKQARVVPIPKTGNSSDISSYRPISVLPTVSKILEKHVKVLLQDHLKQQAPISTRQWGFMRSRSTASALVQVTDDLCKAVDKNFEVAVVFFDVRKAFDTVPHLNLLMLLHELGVNSYLVNWIKSYLLNREQFVVIDGTESHPIHVVSGVPQGSVLGPLLFITYINKITQVVSPGTYLNLFADDIVMYRTISSTNDYQILQKDIDSIATFMDDKLLSLNEAKCKFMFVTRKKACSIPPPALTLRNYELQRVVNYKYLGVTLTSDLSWKTHIQLISNKARKQVGILYRKFSPHTQPSTMLSLYKAFVRPILEYAAIAWSPYLVGEINHIEKVQKFALRVCLKRWDRYATYEELCDAGDLQTLSARRNIARLCHIFKTINGKTDFSMEQFTTMRCTHNSRNIRESLLQPLNCKTNLYKHSFIPRTIEMWNALVSKDGPTILTISNMHTFTKLVIDTGILDSF